MITQYHDLGKFYSPHKRWGQNLKTIFIFKRAKS